MNDTAILLSLLLPLPLSILFLVLGWRATRRLPPDYLRDALRALLLASTLTPSVVSHAGPTLAWWVLLLGPRGYRLSFGLKPILVVCFVILCIAFLRRHSRPPVSISSDGS